MTRNLPYFIHLAMVFFLAAGLHADSETDLVEIQAIDPTIRIELKYASADNLAGRVLYPPQFKAQLRRGAAMDLKKAQDALRPMGVGLKIWDAYRPLEVQKALFAIVSNPIYVAAPGVHSMHNRGAAVDVTLVDLEGRELAMPTKFDFMGHAASYFYDGGNPLVLKNLVLLQRVMSQSGFYACRTEWWHFFSRDWKKFPNVEDAAVLRKKTTVCDPYSYCTRSMSASAVQRILIVEDHADSALMLTRLLKRAGYDVQTAGRVADALALAQSAENDGTPINLVVSDLGLPDGTGYDLMRRLRQDYHLQGIALSGYGQTDDVRRAISSGFSHHLTKPIDADRLKMVIREVLEKELTAHDDRG